MSSLRFGVLGAMAFAAASMISTTTQAATCGPGGGTHTFTLTTGGADASCFAYGEGNLNGNVTQNGLSTTFVAAGYSLPVPTKADPMIYNGFTFLGKTDTPGAPADGNWSFDVTSLYNVYVFAWKVGNDASPNWAAFLLENIASLGALTGAYGISPDQAGGMSHFNVYGFYDPNLPPAGGPGETPIPGAAFLMGSVLAGGAGFGAWRRRRREKFAA